MKEEQADVEPDPDQEDMEDVILDKKGSVTGGWFSRTMMERWTMGRHCYIIRGGIYT